MSDFVNNRSRRPSGDRGTTTPDRATPCSLKLKHAPLQSVTATRYEQITVSLTSEELAEETPIALLYNGRSHAVMMATPADLDDFAYGFTLTEGIVDHVDEIEIIDRLHTDAGISLQMLIPQHRTVALRERDRNLTGPTGCGLCGAATLAAAIRPVRRVHPVAAIDTDALFDGFHRLNTGQVLNHASGAVHGAALLTAGGEILIREDVGRHNAVDKVIGACVSAASVPGALLVTSRASYEIVHKAAQVGCPLVAAISAPTAMAVRIAAQAGITLIGFARDDRMTFYTGDVAQGGALKWGEA